MKIENSVTLFNLKQNIFSKKINQNKNITTPTYNRNSANIIGNYGKILVSFGKNVDIFKELEKHTTSSISS